MVAVVPVQEKPRKDWKGYLYIILASSILGTIGVLVKLMGDNVPYMTINFYRVFFAFVFLSITMPFVDKETFKFKRSDIKIFALMGLFYTLALSFHNTAYKFAPVQNIVILGYTYPIFVMLVERVMLKEKITATKMVAFFLALVGLWVMNPFQTGEYAIGNILVTLSAIATSGMLVGLRILRSYSPGKIVWFFLFASLFLLPMPIMYGLGNLAAALPYILLLGVFSTGCGYFFYKKALELMDAGKCSIIEMVVGPVVAITLALNIIGEQLQPKTLVGGSILLLSGIFLESAHHIPRVTRHLSSRILALRSRQ